MSYLKGHKPRRRDVCPSKDLVKAFADTTHGPEARSCFINPESKAHTLELSMVEIIQKYTDPKFFPIKDRVRSIAVRELHEIIGRPNDFVACKFLDIANLIGTHLTSVNVKMPTSS